MPSDTATCAICDRNFAWHREHRPRHLFKDVLGQDHSLEIEPAELDSKGVDKVIQNLPTDPILRLALIDKGLLEPDDLQAAEAKLRASGGFAVGRSDAPGKREARP